MGGRFNRELGLGTRVEWMVTEFGGRDGAASLVSSSGVLGGLRRRADALASGRSQVGAVGVAGLSS